MMTKVYVYSDEIGLAAELIGLGRELGSEVHAVALDVDDAQALTGSGAASVQLLKGDSDLPESYARAVGVFLTENEAEVFLVGSTARGRDLAAQVAGLVECPLISEATQVAVSGTGVTTERIMYGGAVVASETTTGFTVVTVGAGSHDPVTGAAEVVTTEVAIDPRLRRISLEQIVSKGSNAADADRVVSVGMGFNDKADLAIVEDLAAALGAGIGCSRGVAEERQWLEPDQYIGISGLQIRPRLYLAAGISGQVQHMVGVRDAKIIVAINKDPKAPIFDACDYGIVGDMYQILPALTGELNA